MRQPRNLSGCYFRFQHPETGKWENWCFEDLPVEKQKEYLKDRTDEWKDSMILLLARTIQDIGDFCDVKNTEA